MLYFSTKRICSNRCWSINMDEQTWTRTKTYICLRCIEYQCGLNKRGRGGILPHVTLYIRDNNEPEYIKDGHPNYRPIETRRYTCTMSETCRSTPACSCLKPDSRALSCESDLEEFCPEWCFNCLCEADYYLEWIFKLKHTYSRSKDHMIYRCPLYRLLPNSTSFLHATQHLDRSSSHGVQLHLVLSLGKGCETSYRFSRWAYSSVSLWFKQK